MGGYRRRTYGLARTNRNVSGIVVEMGLFRAMKKLRGLFSIPSNNYHSKKTSTTKRYPNNNYVSSKSLVISSFKNVINNAFETASTTSRAGAKVVPINRNKGANKRCV